MPYALVEFREEHVAAARAFNQRMRAAGGDVAAGFLLPETVDHSVPRLQHYVVTDATPDGDFVRGGCLIDRRPHWLAAGGDPVWNIQSPLSEGVIDRRHSPVAVLMLKSLLQQNPLIYGVGMGAESKPFPRLVKALGWSVQPVPFFFRVLRGNRFLQQVRALRSPAWRDAVARLAAATRLGAPAFNLLHFRPGPRRSGQLNSVERFSPAIDKLWQQCHEQWSFASCRDAAALNAIYGPNFPGQRWELTDSSGAVAGWATTVVTSFQEHQHFGTLRVATLADFIAQPASQEQLIERVVQQMRAAGADLVVSNQLDPPHQAALRARGFLPGPSNFLLAASKALTTAIGSGPVHLNRGDGDGLINLM